MAAKYTFGKKERLKSNLVIQELLKNGHSVSKYPLKLFWKISSKHDQKFPARVAIAVPKRRFKRAVDRNLIKRRLRESYRLNKSLICDPLQEKNLHIDLMILFLSDEFISFDNLNAAMPELLGKLAAKLP